MRYFDTYVSACTAGCGNQSYFTPNSPDTAYTARAFFRLEQSGRFGYSLLFSNILDSTYSNGSHSARNRICEPWEILDARVGTCAVCNCAEMTPIGEWHPLTFGGKAEKSVAPGEFFTSDEVTLNAEENEFLCLEMTYRGRELPYHEESLLPIFLQEGEEWTPTKKMPLPGMIGCRRTVKKRIGLIGDSITQGCGTEPNSYTHYGARIAKILGSDYSFWDLGLGYGRANDAASLGAWFYKAKQVDVITVCYGVNDLLQGFPVEQTKKDMRTLVENLKKEGLTVILQTVPPFSYQGDNIRRWHELNEYIQTELSKVADGIFDVVPILGQGGDLSHMAKYGDHPDGEGHKVWSEALAPVLRTVLEA